MAPVTEIAVLRLKSGLTRDDIAVPGSAWQDSIHTVLEQEGAQQCYWGTLVEDASDLRFFVDWESLETHQKFQASDTITDATDVSRAYGPFVDRLMSMLDGTPTLYHAALTPHPPSTALSSKTSPVTELLTIYFSASMSSADQSAFDNDLRHLLAVTEKAGQGYIGCAVGWSIEEVALPKESSRNMKACFVAVGWQSMEDHKRFHDTQEYKDNIHHLLNAKDLQTFIALHTHLHEVRA